MGIRKYIVTLTSEERERLTRLVSSGKDKAYRIKHANILLAADENGPNLTSQAIAKAFSSTTVALRTTPYFFMVS